MPPRRDSGAEPSKPRLVDRQSRVALPPEVLRALGVGPGDHVVFEVEGGRVSLHKVKWSVERR